MVLVRSVLFSKYLRFDSVAYLAGILQMLLSCPSAIVEKHWILIISTLTWLVNIQDPDGNWPSKAPEHLKGVAETHDLLQSVSGSFSHCRTT
jgi:hypothetical protein